MKSFTSLLFWILLGVLLTSCTDHRIKTSFFTQGNCEACKPLIEEALRSKSAVKEVEWMYESSVTVVIYDTTAISFSELQQAVSDAGFDTGYFAANEEAKKNLPACCQEVTSREIKPYRPLPPGHGQE